MRYKFVLWLIIPLCNCVFAQQEYHKWYFGNKAAIDFSNGTPAAITNSSMNATDNTASISDASGNILFYCDGINIYNRNHTLMPNGAGLLGNLSGGHAATAVQKPGSNNLYYLFTMDAFAGANGLRYNVIDMTLNGGLGDVIAGQKDILLLGPASEQIIPVIHANQTDIWIVTHPWNSSSFNCYLLSCSGLNTTPVVSTVGNVRSGNGNNATGQINVSPTNDRIACANWGTDTWELFDFDNATGTLSNALAITNNTQPWAVEFSPDGSKLYVSGWTTHYVSQYNLSTYTQTAIAASEVDLGDVNGPGSPYFTGYMQRAPDGKIYIAVYLDPFLAVINNPNVAGIACNMVDNGFNLGGRTSTAGLPNKTIVRQVSPSILGSDTSFCGNFSYTLSTGNAGTQWSTGATAAQITVTVPGTYWASYTPACGDVVSDTIVITQTTSVAVNIGNDTTLCNGQTMVIDVTTAGATYQWQDNSTANNYTVTTAGTYSVTINDGNSCNKTGSLNALYNTLPPSINLGPDVQVCDNQPLFLNPHYANASYSWSTGSNDSVLQVSTSGNYQVTVSTGCGSATDEINVLVYQDECAVLIPTAFSPNGDGNNDVFRGVCRCPVERYSMQVYNRWGEEVFGTEQVNEGWDGVFRGVQQPLSVYVFQIDYFNYCEQKMKKVVGNVTLVR